MTTLINQIGPRVTAAVAAEAPGVAVVEAAPDATDGYAGPADVLFAPGRAPGRDSWEAVLGQCERSGVRWVHLAGAGAGDPPPALFEGGRVLTCSRGVYARPIAEFVLAALLAFEQRHPAVWIDAPPAGAWGYPSRPPDGEDGAPSAWPPFDAPPRWGWADLGGLDGRTLGLVGFGGIGRRVAELAVAFGMDVVAVRRREEDPGIPGVRIAADLREVLRAADHLVLAAAATPATARLLDAVALRDVRRGVHVVNVARGGLIDQDALRAALDDGRVALATLDVADPEPLPPGHWLYSHPRVRLSPHCSWCSPAGQEPVIARFVDNLRRYVQGRPLTGVVDAGERY